MSVVMKTIYGVEYVVDHGLTSDEAEALKEYVETTCSESYFDNLMVNEVVIR